MCGIAGLVVPRGNPDPDVASVEAMLAVLARRGPDACGIERFRGAVLGHRRLAIFDTSPAGNQPMTSEDGDLSVVFNGAIYNFPALRRELSRAGFGFRSGTDTEVLIHGYRHWGMQELVRRLEGMFAFGLWDDRSEELFLVRDRLGQKPLAYRNMADGGIRFASTPGAVAAGQADFDLNPQAVADFLEWGFVPEDTSVFSDVEKLPPATILRWKQGRHEKQTYWSFPDSGSRPDTFDEAVETTEDLILRAVECRLKADVPLAALLSGGIDSALVCWGISELGGDLTAFTVAAPGEPEDESSDAAATARKLGLRHEVLELPSVQPSLIDELVEAFSEPFATASGLGMLAISRQIHGCAKVVLTGDGGDDAFLGYPHHRYLASAQRVARAVPGPLLSMVGRPLHRWRPPGPLRRVASFSAYTAGGLGAFLTVRDGWDWFDRHQLRGPRLLDQTPASRALPWSRRSARNILQDYLTYTRGHQFVSEYLVKVDGATMWHALEARSPLLDQHLWEYAVSLRREVLQHQGELKPILRAIASRRVSPKLGRGKKRGFEIPIQRWLARDWYPMLKEGLADSRVVDHGWLDGDALASILRRVEGSSRIPIQLWHTFVLDRWLRLRCS